MDYQTVGETAKTWGVSSRWVRLCARDGRVPGAVKAGNIWLLPLNTSKPQDARSPFSRKDKQAASPSSAHNLADVLAKTNQPVPQGASGVFLAAIKDTNIRLVYEGAFAYLRGDFIETIRCYHSLGKEQAPRLAAASLAIAAAISLGDNHFYAQVESFLTDTIRGDECPEVSVYAELALATASLGALAPGLLPSWLKNGDFSGLFPQTLPFAAYMRAKYYQCLGQHETMLAVAQTALAFNKIGDRSTLVNTYLKLMCAVACFALNRPEEAETRLLEAMRDSLPLGYITPFVEMIPYCAGKVEQLLQREYPHLYSAALRQWQQTHSNWIVFHNRFTKENITTLLSPREYEIAVLVARGMPRREIAGLFDLSSGRLNNILTEIYAKLYITGRAALRELIIF